MHRFIHSFSIGLACVTASATAHSGQLFVVSAKPRFEQRDRLVYLIVSDTNHSFDIFWAMPPNVPIVPVSLDTNRVYTFTVVQTPLESTTIPELRTIPEVRRVQSNGETIYDIEMCEVHKTKMQHKEVKIAYGLIVPGPDDPSPDTERRLFPNRHEHALGGCIVSPDNPKTTKVYVCSECKQAFEWWSGTAIASYSVLPRDTRYDHSQHLRLVYLEAYGKAYVAEWARKEVPSLFGPVSEDDKARVFGYLDGAAAGRTARDAWSGANGQPYGPTNSASPKR